MEKNVRTGLEFLRDPGTPAKEIAKLLRTGHPPVGPVDCDEITCKDCWMAWLPTGRAPERKGKTG